MPNAPSCTPQVPEACPLELSIPNVMGSSINNNIYGLYVRFYYFCCAPPLLFSSVLFRMRSAIACRQPNRIAAATTGGKSQVGSVRARHARLLYDYRVVVCLMRARHSVYSVATHKTASRVLIFINIAKQKKNTYVYGMQYPPNRWRANSAGVSFFVASGYSRLIERTIRYGTK